MGTFQYSVPNSNQCKECHKEYDEVVGVLGSKARHPNKSYTYTDGEENQLVKWTELRRRRIHGEAVDVVAEWIASLEETGE